MFFGSRTWFAARATAAPPTEMGATNADTLVETIATIDAKRKTRMLTFIVLGHSTLHWPQPLVASLAPIRIASRAPKEKSRDAC